MTTPETKHQLAETALAIGLRDRTTVIDPRQFFTMVVEELGGVHEYAKVVAEGLKNAQETVQQRYASMMLSLQEQIYKEESKKTDMDRYSNEEVFLMLREALADVFPKPFVEQVMDAVQPAPEPPVPQVEIAACAD